MKDEAKQWLQYAKENQDSAKILKDSKLFNPCLQSIQQSVEKALKSVLIEKALKLKRTHSIFELRHLLEDNRIPVDLSDDECDFLDTIYLPSKYSLGSALPDFDPNEELCQTGIMIAEKVFKDISTLLQ